jgi:hypothetical protein
MARKKRSLPGEELSPIEIPYQVIAGTHGQRYFNVNTGRSISRQGMLNQVAGKYGFRSYNDYLQFSRSLGGIGGLTNESRPRPYDISRMYALARKWEKSNGLPVGSFETQAPFGMKNAMNLYINSKTPGSRDHFLELVLDRFRVNGKALRDIKTARYQLGETPRRRAR